MRDPDDKKQFAQIVRSTMLVCVGEAPEPDVLRIWWASLHGYTIEAVSAAFSEYAMRGKFAPKPSDILYILDRLLPDGRPGADEAWAMIPMDEFTSAVMTQEMAEALHIAQPLLDAGDKIAARMAFKEAYTRIVDANKRNGVKPSWFPSLGQDKECRDSVLAEAVRLGRLSADHAIGLLPPDKVAPMLQCAGEEKLALEYKMPSAEEAMARIEKMKAALKIKEAA
jgi:hypothetical protein